MKYNQLYKELRKAGCLLTQHGAEHDEWTNPATGAKIRIPRHGSHEVKTGVVKENLQGIARTLIVRAYRPFFKSWFAEVIREGSFLSSIS